ncbi:hypothetical protein SLEP1_g55244 [Rubroshorea leprosula]|uniref:Uncharacterized protein n=1 Tax=Rubroshorea leprosula TaxID=152421 RepID=A0AAV5MET3_9ROSI|nr:hypothetical protein SLEP1_g55244 [Rubroshorea leprosula]
MQPSRDKKCNPPGGERSGPGSPNHLIDHRHEKLSYSTSHVAPPCRLLVRYECCQGESDHESNSYVSVGRRNKGHAEKLLGLRASLETRCHSAAPIGHRLHPSLVWRRCCQTQAIPAFPMSLLVRLRLSRMIGMRGAAAKVETKQVKKESQERWKLSTWGLAKERRLKTLDLCSESTGRENLKVESIGGCRVRSDGESKGLFFGRNSKDGAAWSGGLFFLGHCLIQCGMISLDITMLLNVLI